MNKGFSHQKTLREYRPVVDSADVLLKAGSRMALFSTASAMSSNNFTPLIAVCTDARDALYLSHSVRVSVKPNGTARSRYALIIRLGRAECKCSAYDNTANVTVEAHSRAAAATDAFVRGLWVHNAISVIVSPIRQASKSYCRQPSPEMYSMAYQFDDGERAPFGGARLRPQIRYARCCTHYKYCRRANGENGLFEEQSEVKVLSGEGF